MSKAYSLLYVDPSATSLNNLREAADLSSRLELYLRNALLLSNSLRICGIHHYILTNNSSLLSKANFGKQLLESLNLQIIPTSNFDLPVDIPHRAAFHKLDAWRWIAMNGENYSLMLDLDMVCLSADLSFWKYLYSNEVSCYYDVTDQAVPAWSAIALSQEQRYMLQQNCLGRWAGGEFLAGNREFFNQLSNLAFSYMPLYSGSSYQILSGEEAILSASLDSYRTNNALEDIGSLGIVSRFWRGTVKHYQKPLEHHLNAMFLHLPGDKPFLASYQLRNPGPFDPDHFRAEYSSLCMKNIRSSAPSKWQRTKSAFKKLLR